MPFVSRDAMLARYLLLCVNAITRIIIIELYAKYVLHTFVSMKRRFILLPL